MSIWTEQALDMQLSIPSQRLIEDMGKIDGDIMILGAGGKMGPTLSVLAKKAITAANTSSKVISVSRFSDPIVRDLMHDQKIDTISVDLLEPGALHSLPDVKNVIYMAGRKFGTDGLEPLTWAMNTWLPSLVAERYKHSRIVVFSSGNVYPMVPVHSGGATEETLPSPIGEYGMSCLGRERLFEYGSSQYKTPVFLYRLNYAVDLRYGILHDIASNVMDEKTIELNTPCFNCIWQGDANEIALRALLHVGSPAVKMNITGPETVSVRYTALAFGKLFGKKPVFSGNETGLGLLSDSKHAVGLFGYPSVSLETMIQWQAEWILSGGRTLGKPTHFEERSGKY